jgi:hypothetical protein
VGVASSWHLWYLPPSFFFLLSHWPSSTYTVSHILILTHFTVKMKMMCSSKMLLTTYKSTWYHNPEDQDQQLHCCENLRFVGLGR